MSYVYAVRNKNFYGNQVMFGTTNENPQKLLDLTDDKNYYYVRVKKITDWNPRTWLRDVFTFLKRETGDDWFECENYKIEEIFDMTSGDEWVQRDIDEITGLLEMLDTEDCDSESESDVDDPYEYGVFSDEEHDYQDQRWD